MTKFALMLVCVSAMLLATGSVHASYGYEQWAKELGIHMDASYSARRVMESKHGTMEFVERRAPQKAYMEFVQQGVKGAMLVREDRDKAYVLMPTMGMYRETSISEATAQAGGSSTISDVQKIGTEVVNGVDCTKYKATFKDSNGRGDGFVWVSDDGIPMRMDMTYNSGDVGDRLNMVLHDLQRGPQDPAVFEVPSDLKPFSLGGLQIPGLGGGDGEPPSDEDIEKGMDKLKGALEEMRKRMNQ